MTELGAWLREAKHLPPPLRDFHDQKDTFKSLHGWMEKQKQADGNRPWDMPTWVDGHIYVIDYFLRFMALCGWTLQRSRQRLPFASLAQTIKADRDAEAKLVMAAFDAKEVAP